MTTAALILLVWFVLSIPVAVIAGKFIKAGGDVRFFVEQGSVYAPGWHVYERVRDNHLVSVACFDEKSDADEHLAWLLTREVDA